jgi:hypothetical protein
MPNDNYNNDKGTISISGYTITAPDCYTDLYTDSHGEFAGQPVVQPVVDGRISLIMPINLADSSLIICNNPR